MVSLGQDLGRVEAASAKKGRVSARLIDGDATLPSWGTVVRHFGSLKAAYELVGLVRLPGKPVRFGLPSMKKHLKLTQRGVHAA